MDRLRPRFKSHEQSRTKRSATDLYDAAVRHFLSKRYGQAEDCCRQALTLNTKHADSLHLLGLVHWQTNRLDLAVDLIASAIRCNPNNHEYFLNLGELLREQNKLDEARKSFDIAIKLAPNRAAGWIKLGNLLRIQRRYDEVLLTYEHAFTLDPNNAEASALSAGVLLELGRHEEALAKCDLSVAISTDQVEVLCVKGDCLRNLGRTAEAAASYRRASELEPDRVSVWRLLGKVLEQLGDRDGAIKALRRARDIDPSDRFGASVELMRLGADELSEMPPAYVRLLFDQYAAKFDTALVESLGYRGPSVLVEAVRSACQAHQKPANFKHAIDLGCGMFWLPAAFWLSPWKDTTATVLLWARAGATLIVLLMCVRRSRQPVLWCYSLNSNRSATREACPCQALRSLRRNRELFAMPGCTQSRRRDCNACASALGLQARAAVLYPSRSQPHPPGN